MGAASLLVGLWQGFPVAGGLSQSAVNEKGGARTPLSLVVASAVVGLVLLFFTGLFRNLPEAVLAAIVLVAVAGLIDLKELRYLWHASWIDFAAAGVALAGVLLLGVLDGVVIAVPASAAMLLFRVTRPHVAFLGRIAGTDRFSDITRHPENEAVLRAQRTSVFERRSLPRRCHRRAQRATPSTDEGELCEARGFTPPRRNRADSARR